MPDAPRHHIIRNEDDAVRVFCELCDTYGWAGAILSRGDAAFLLDRELDDDAWQRVRSSPGWTYVTDEMVDAACTAVRDADAWGDLDRKD